MGDYFTKHHPPHHHREICVTYSYMSNTLLKTNQQIVNKWANAVLMPIHTVSVTPGYTKQSGKTVLLRIGVLMGYVRRDTQYQIVTKYI